MKYLVSGNCGFIGSNLVKQLKKEGHEVIGFDNFTTGKEHSCEMIGTFELDTLKSFDGIFHLGMPSSSPIYKKEPVKACTAMTQVSMRALEAARNSKCPIVYASSSSIYNGWEPPHQEVMFEKNKDYYTIMRYWLERMAFFYFKQHKVPSIGLRIFSCYGPGDPKKYSIANVVTQFAIDIIKGRRPLIYGDGTQSRDFTHVDDVVKGFIKSMEYLKESPISTIINIGTGETTSFKESVKIINKTLKTHIRPKYTKNQIHNYVFTTQADTSKMEALLGFKGLPFNKAFPKYIRWLK